MEKIIIAIVLINLIASLIARKKQQDAKKRAARQSGIPEGPPVADGIAAPSEKKRKESMQREHAGRDAALREEGTRRKYTGRDALDPTEDDSAEKTGMPTPMKKGMAVGRDFLEEMAREMGLNIPREDQPGTLKERPSNESSFVLESPERPLGSEPALNFEENTEEEWRETDSGDGKEITSGEKRPAPYHPPHLSTSFSGTPGDSDTSGRSARKWLKGRKALRRAFIGKTVLDPPVGLTGPGPRPWDPDPS